MKIIECPRDAMQGINRFIDTDIKVAYINQLLKVGFDTIDFGSFVSPKAVPQMHDTALVLEKLAIGQTETKLLSIVANLRGAESAGQFPAIDYLGFPLSLSETFQQRNTNRSTEEAYITLQNIQEVCLKTGKTLVVYLSMGFGNPYGDLYDVEIVLEFMEKLIDMEVEIISLSDTIGIAEPKQVSQLFKMATETYPAMEIGVHLHSNTDTAEEKIAAAYEAGCKRFDGTLKGYGGCPMAKDELVGNMPTEKIIDYLERQDLNLGIDQQALEESMRMAATVFGKELYS